MPGLLAMTTETDLPPDYFPPGGLHGNDCRESAWHSCPICGTDAMCDVCHEHDEPRGECSECPDVIEDVEGSS